MRSATDIIHYIVKLCQLTSREVCHNKSSGTQRDHTGGNWALTPQIQF